MLHLHLPIPRRTLPLLAFLVPLVGVFLWLALTTGPLAPIPVTLTTVQVDGIAWEYVVPEKSKERHFVADVKGSTVVLTTTGGREALEDLAHAVAKETR